MEHIKAATLKTVLGLYCGFNQISILSRKAQAIKTKISSPKVQILSLKFFYSRIQPKRFDSACIIIPFRRGRNVWEKENEKYYNKAILKSHGPEQLWDQEIIQSQYQVLLTSMILYLKKVDLKDFGVIMTEKAAGIMNVDNHNSDCGSSQHHCPFFWHQKCLVLVNRERFIWKVNDSAVYIEEFNGIAICCIP